MQADCPPLPEMTTADAGSTSIEPNWTPPATAERTEAKQKALRKRGAFLL